MTNALPTRPVLIGAAAAAAGVEEQIEALSGLRDRLREVLETCACGGDLRAATCSQDSESTS